MLDLPSQEGTCVSSAPHTTTEGEVEMTLDLKCIARVMSLMDQVSTFLTILSSWFFHSLRTPAGKCKQLLLTSVPSPVTFVFITLSSCHFCTFSSFVLLFSFYGFFRTFQVFPILVAEESTPLLTH